jgi:putative Mg2+ transporter-C (MgtC) family protein|tara:strand:- start:8796 stop:9320 length:525 start_codon:yes stop_codon:yes gene_type:complete
MHATNRPHVRFPLMADILTGPDSLSWAEALWRLGAATVLPFLIGLERFLRTKPIDFRPFVIISVAACALAIGAMELLETIADPGSRIDPSRIFEGVITGIGFLGAGAIFREGSFVQGAGSAASIWAAGAIGLVCGFGEIWLGVIITAIVLTVLIASAPFTAHWDPAQQENPPAP